VREVWPGPAMSGEAGMREIELGGMRTKSEITPCDCVRDFMEIPFACSFCWRRMLTSANLLRGTLLQLAMVCLLEAIFPCWLALALLVVLVSYVVDGRWLGYAATNTGLLGGIEGNA